MGRCSTDEVGLAGDDVMPEAKSDGTQPVMQANKRGVGATGPQHQLFFLCAEAARSISASGALLVSADIRTMH